MRSLLRSSMVAALVVCAAAPHLAAFCGFYVSKADAKLFNKASRVVLVRDGDRTVLTMANDFKGDPKEFAVVIPVPTALRREQIRVGDPALVDHLDAYSAPRLVEYFDENPCRVEVREYALASMAIGALPTNFDAAAARAKTLGVTVEAQYSIGEYDILILSASESAGLETWLRENRYRIPPGASQVISSYLKQNMRFFVAKVNLAEHAKLGFSYLRPLQVAYESPKFMLPIRLGTVNADGPQELFVYALTRKGRIEPTNYRSTKLRSDVELPVYLKEPGEFAKFYRALFSRQVDEEDGRVVFLEYSWDMRWCDPCAADPLSAEQLADLGVFWIDRAARPANNRAAGRPLPPAIRGQADVFLTRLHVRYDKAHFPEDLVFQETSDRTNFQGRYVLRHPWTGGDACPAMADYRRTIDSRHEREAEQLAKLTGWDIRDIRAKMNVGEPASPEPTPATWWQRLWRK